MNKKWTKVDACFSVKKTPLSRRKLFVDQNMTQILYQKSFITFSESKYGKIMVNVQKRLKGASAEAGFWYGENIDHVKKKNSK